MSHAPDTASYSLAVVILGAGRSRRMGRPKLLLPWGKTSVLGHLINQWRALQAEQIAVVHARADEVLQREMDRIGVPQSDRVENPLPDRGMFSSIQCAAQWSGWKARLTHWAIVLGDQPHLRASTLQAVRDFSAANPERICQPAHASHRRHPVLVPRPAFLELANSKAADLKSFLVSRPVAVCEVDDPGLPLDIDGPEDYAEALALAFG